MLFDLVDQKEDNLLVMLYQHVETVRDWLMVIRRPINH